MLGAKGLTLFLAAPAIFAASFDGARALEFTRRVTAFGPHPSGSPAISKARSWIRDSLKGCGCQVSEDAFTAQTPDGPTSMVNLIARFPGNSGYAIVLSGHYDTKRLPGFAGANDGGSSTGFLLELARALAGAPRRDDVVLVWFDGEEAVREWSESDGLYGSRHLADRWQAAGKLKLVKALVNVDMIGDRDLNLLEDTNSSAALRLLARHFSPDLFTGGKFGIDDDHMPFVRMGVNALDLIDFDYGPSNSYWHTTQDTMDKLSAGSFAKVGSLVLSMVEVLESGR